jgi:imidazolonepropionase-like amidohydrolase
MSPSISPERAAPLLKATVSIRNDRIVSVGNSPSRNSDRIIDGSGLYLTPGLIDSHVHLGDVPRMTLEQLEMRRLADAGLTPKASTLTTRS